MKRPHKWSSVKKVIIPIIQRHLNNIYKIFLSSLLENQVGRSKYFIKNKNNLQESIQIFFKRQAYFSISNVDIYNSSKERLGSANHPII